jgi:hypothetical protein
LTSKTSSAVIAFLLAVSGIALFLIRYFPLGISPQDVIVYAAMLIGLFAVFASFGSGRKAMLFVSSAVFLTGAALFTVGQMDIISRQQVTFPAALIIAGLSLLMLFLDEMKNKVFALTGLFLIISGVLFVYLRRDFAFISFANNLGYNLMSFWPVYILIAGTVYLLRKKV